MSFSPASRQLRQFASAWRRGSLAWSVLAAGVAVLVLVAAAGMCADRSLVRQAAYFDAVITREAALRDTEVDQLRAAEPPDFVRRLPDPPAVAQVLQTLQRAADAHGVRMASLQAEEQPATATALRRLDVAVTLRAGYPAVVAVLREVLGRYPGATLRRLEIARAPQLAGQAAMAAMQGAATIETEAHATFGFWSRPAGVVRAEGYEVETAALAASAAGSASLAASRSVGATR